jgi:hypothetical protein
MANKNLHTGDKATKSGIYHVLGTKNEIILSTGDRVPPYDKKAANIVLVREVKHQNKQ